MQQTEFVETIHEREGLDSNDETETVTVATLQTLGTRISESMESSNAWKTRNRKESRATPRSFAERGLETSPAFE